LNAASRIAELEQTNAQLTVQMAAMTHLARISAH
jgi:hypothetical protein